MVCFKRVVCTLVLLTTVMASSSWAQSAQPVLIHPAVFGTVREVTGSELLIASPRANCPVKMQPVAGGPCFDKILTALGPQGRVLGLTVPAQANDRVSGGYGRDYVLYDVMNTPKGVEAHALDLPTSNVRVPRDCFALPGEDVGYVIGINGPLVARESQFVVCDGGARQPQGPYRLDGPPLASDHSDGWRRSEQILNMGQRRYLAAPGSCDPQYSLRTTWCAQPAVMFLQANPDQAELDVIAAQHPVQPGDVLRDGDIKQWVMKRKTHGFYPDDRWFAKSMLTAMPGCAALGPIGWRISQESDGLYVTEQALNRCGAPGAPVPADIYEAYGDELFVVDCADRHDGWGDHGNHHDQGGPPSSGTCLDSAGDYLRHTGRKSATVIVLNERARPDDHLFSGSRISYDVAQVSWDRDNHLKADKIDSNASSFNMTMRNCTPVTDGPPESHGYVLARSMGVTVARAYQWMSCSLY